MRKKILCSVLFFLFVLSFPQKIYASSNFTIASDVSYDVTDKGVTHTTIHNVLTNTTSDYYATSYVIKVGFDSLSNTHASDPDGPISVQTKKTPDGYSLVLPFNKHVVGMGNSLSFTLSFDTADITQKEGNIWELNIPGIADANSYASFIVHVTVPVSFGSPSYIKPAITPEKSFGSTITFTKEQLQNTAISIAYGKNQSYAFNLHYHIANTNLFPVKTEIALPPSTNYQDVYIQSIQPPPLNVVKDIDGNWLAQYRLYPSQNEDITVSGRVQLYLQPKQQPQTEQELSKYLLPQSYWEVNNPDIQKLAQQLKTPEAIYDYIVKTLTYDYNAPSDKPRYGGLNALAHTNVAVCLEFSDLFVTLARAAGIPAREVDGYGYTQNTKQRPLSLLKDILHAWPEYYDFQRQTWIMIDPTWANTTKGVDYFHTLDFDHFTFTVKGVQSDYPVPAGEYKLPKNQNVKDIDVSITQNFSTIPLRFSLFPNVPTSIIAGIPIKGTIIVTNIGQALIPTQSLQVDTNILLPFTQSISVPEIPPFGSTAVPVSFTQSSFLTNHNDTITIRVAGQTVTQTIIITPLFLTKWAVIGGCIVGLFIIIISIIARKTRRVSIFG